MSTGLARKPDVEQREGGEQIIFSSRTSQGMYYHRDTFGASDLNAHHQMRKVSIQESSRNYNIQDDSGEEADEDDFDLTSYRSETQLIKAGGGSDSKRNAFN